MTRETKRITATFVVGLMIIGLGSNFTLAQAPEISGFEHAWSDTFEGNSLSAELWQAANTNVPTNNSLQDYLPEQVSVGDGKLVITSENSPSRGLPYRSGLVMSNRSQQYGRWEIRAKLPTSRGMWPAIWLLSDINTNPWPSQGEIDIMENRGDEPHFTSSAFHYGTNPPFNHSFILREQQNVQGGVTPNYHNEFHDYAVEWASDQIRFYVNDVHHSTIHDFETGGFISRQSDEMNLIINTAVGGTFLDNPDSSTVWPQTLEVEHVHVYTQTEAGPVLSFENGGFEERGGSLANWTVFGNSIQVGSNVRADVEAVEEGAGSLKLFGQFTGDQNFSGAQQGISVEAGDELSIEASAMVRSADSIAGTGNQAILTIDYFNKIYGAFGTDDLISSESWVIADGSTINDEWLRHEFMALVPDGAVEARLSLLFRQPGTEGGAVHFDNVVFSVVAIPEPSTTSVLIGLLGVAGCRRRRQAS